MSSILTVDDHALNRQFPVSLPGYQGHRVFETADGEEALGLMRQRHLDLLIGDMKMPKMDGLEFVAWLRQERAIAEVLERTRNIASLSCTPVIVVSARDVEKNKERAPQAGAEAYFQKPVDNAELLKSIQEALLK
ncbi:MAG: response regulator [Pyrinomonadaceae bacterium]